MKYALALLLLICLSACIPEPETDNDGKAYYLKAYLFANQKVKDIHVKRISKYGIYSSAYSDSGKTPSVESWVTDAKVTLFCDGTPIPLEFDSFGMRDYRSDHVVKEGSHYSIRAEIYDTLLGKTVTLTAETTCPKRDKTVRLNTKTLQISERQIEKEFWQMYKSPELYPHFVLTLAPSAQYQMLTFAGSGSAIINTWMPTYKKRVPQQTSEMIISPIHFQSYRFYEQYRLVIHHLNKEYADLYVHNGPASDAWLKGNTELVPEGISNVSNGGGIFTAVASDTLNFYLKPAAEPASN